MKRRKKPQVLPPLPPLGPDQRFWAIDLGRRCGWFVKGPGEHEESGVHELYDPDGLPHSYQDGERYAALAHFLDKLEAEHGRPDVVAFEDVIGGTKGRQTAMYFGMRATLMTWLSMRQIPVCPLGVSTIKMAVTGKGNASKEEMIAAARARGYVPFDDNEADAIGIAFALTKIVTESKSLPFVDTDKIHTPLVRTRRKKGEADDQAERRATERAVIRHGHQSHGRERGRRRSNPAQR